MSARTHSRWPSWHTAIRAVPPSAAACATLARASMSARTRSRRP
jgi:hypothetical protein